MIVPTSNTRTYYVMSNNIDAARSPQSPKDPNEGCHAKAIRPVPEMTETEATKKRRRGKDAVIADQERIIEENRQASKFRDRRISELEFENAGLRRRLADDSAEYRQFRDLLPPDVLERAAQLARSASREEFAALARRFHWLRRDLLESCSEVHVRDAPSTSSAYRASEARADRPYRAPLVQRRGEDDPSAP
jgi:hypothetical protein